MDKQRIYDAMLIKAFRADITLGQMWYWLKPYNINPPEPDLKRQPPRIPMRVQSFVGVFLKPLADRLWDTDRSQDIKTLDWMAKLNSENTNRVQENEQQNLYRKNKKDRQKTAFLRNNHEHQKSSGQWGVTKGKTRVRRMK
jgi:hypothetical protein